MVVQIREKTLSRTQVGGMNNPNQGNDREPTQITPIIPQTQVESAASEGEEMQGALGNREDERETVNPTLAASGPSEKGTVPFPGQIRNGEPCDRGERLEENPFPGMGIALAGCAVQFAPKGAKGRTPKHLTLPTHSGTPPTDLMDFLVKFAEYAIAGWVFQGRIHDPDSSRDIEKSR